MRLAAARPQRPRLLHHVWFWLYVLTVVSAIVFFALASRMGEAADRDEPTGGWVPFLVVTFAAGLSSYVVALVLHGRSRR